MANYIDIKTNSQINNLTVDSSTLHVDSANNRVGVGTTTPSVTFEVVGSILADSIALDASFTPTNAVDVTTKAYVDSEITGAINTSAAGLQATSEKGQANGYASLDSNAKVPAAQLPSYVDDVAEYANEASFPSTGETGKLYIDQSDGDIFRWSGSAYVQINNAVSTSDSATQLATARDFSISGDVTASAVSFNGTGDVVLSTTLPEASVTQHEAALTIAQSQVTSLTTDLASKVDDTQISAYGLTLVDDADAAAARTTLGLGSAAITASGDYATAAQGATADTALQSVTESHVTAHEAALTIAESQVTGLTAKLATKADASSLHAVATSGAYSDLSGTPTNVSDFTNDSAFISDITAENVGDLADVSITSASNKDALVYNGSAWVNNANVSFGKWDTTAKTSSFSISSAEYWQGFFVDTSSAAVTVTLPGSPASGELVKIVDVGGNASTNNITIGRNNNNIQGDASDLTVAVNRAGFELMFIASYGWVLTNK